MPSDKLSSHTASQPSSSSNASTRMTPFTCFVRLCTAAACRDGKRMEVLRKIWNNLPEEAKLPYKTLAFANEIPEAKYAVKGEFFPKNSSAHDAEEDGSRDSYSQDQSSLWGSTSTLVGDDLSLSGPASQESVITIIDPDEITHIRSFGPSDDDAYAANSPTENQQEIFQADGPHVQRYIWVYDPETLKRS